MNIKTIKDEIKRMQFKFTYDSQEYMNSFKGVFKGFRIKPECIQVAQPIGWKLPNGEKSYSSVLNDEQADRKSLEDDVAAGNYAYSSVLNDEKADRKSFEDAMAAGDYEEI